MPQASLFIFWLLALSPGLLHPIVLYIYFVRYATRKASLLELIDRKRDGGTGRLAATRDQMVEWRQRLDLNLISYQLPTAICALLSMTGGVVLVSLHDPSNVLALPLPLVQLIHGVQPSIVAGFAGAFVWGMFDFVDRFRILNLSPAALHMTWFRLLLGPILGFYIQFIVKDTIGPFLAFGLGTVPVPEIAKWVRDKARNALSISATAAAAPGWEMLEGLTEDMIPRLVEADVSSVSHLANQDPINLLRRTNMEWRNVLDMMDQAYLCGYVTDGLAKLRKRGVRGAVEMAILHQRLNSQETMVKQEAEALVKGIAVDLGVDEASVRNLCGNLFEDPQVDLIWTLWYQRDHTEG